MKQGTRALRLAAGGVLVVGSSGAAALVAATPAGASTFSVSNTNDSGAGSLRQAVLDANANAGADTITFDPSVTGTITLTSGQIAISDSVTITGPGAATLTVSGNDASRIFDVTGTTDLAISDLTMAHGKIIGAGSNYEQGGALRLKQTGATTISGVVFQDNEVDGLGGAIGGATYKGGCFTGDLTITDSEFTGNLARGGGAVGFYCWGSGTVTITGSSFTGNQAGHGDTTFRNGGAVRISGDKNIVVSDSTFENNAVLPDPANPTSLDAEAGAGYFGGWSRTTTITGVTVNNNSAQRAPGFIIFTSNAATVANSTFTDNHELSTNPQVGAGALSLQAPGGNGAGTYKVLQTTISGNTSNGGAVSGLGIHHRQGRPQPTVDLYGSIVAGNIGGSDLGTGGGDFAGNLSDNLFTLNVARSVVGSVRAATPVTDKGGNQQGVTDPKLAPLANNGGRTKTMALLAGSPALDAGGPTAPTFPGNQFDQRGSGFARVVNGLVDVGAFEAQPPTLSSVSPPEGPLVGGTTITLNGTNFAAGMTVTVGGAACTDVVVVSSTEATCTVPPGSAGAVDVAIDVLGLAASLPEAFTYVADPNGEVVPTFTG